MRYQVPQFIEIEDKIIGPLTIKQFVYLAGGAGMAFIIITYIPLFLAIFLVPAVVGLALALAFYKSNNRDFIETLEAMFNFYTKDKLYIWKKEQKSPLRRSAEEAEKLSETPKVFVPRLSESKLKDLAWSLDINENVNPLTGQGGKNTK